MLKNLKIAAALFALAFSLPSSIMAQKKKAQEETDEVHAHDGFFSSNSSRVCL